MRAAKKAKLANQLKNQKDDMKNFNLSLGEYKGELLKIVGFDDIPAARRNHPEVSTVYQPSIEKGRLAAMMVLDPDNHASILLPTTLHIRETS